MYDRHWCDVHYIQQKKTFATMRIDYNKSDELRDPPSYLDEVKIGRGWVQN